LLRSILVAKGFNRRAPAGARLQFYGDELDKVSFVIEGKALELGAKVEFVTPHCDPAVNLHNFYHCVRGDVLVDIWPVDARAVL
jgi:3-hydroxy-D-aspartate aldolase